MLVNEFFLYLSASFGSVQGLPFCISLCKEVSQVKGKYEDPYLVIAWPPPITAIIAIVTTSGLYFLHIVPAVTSPERPSGVRRSSPAVPFARFMDLPRPVPAASERIGTLHQARIEQA